MPANAASGTWIGSGGGTGMCGAQLCLYYNSASHGRGNYGYLCPGQSGTLDYTYNNWA